MANGDVVQPEVENKGIPRNKEIVDISNNTTVLGVIKKEILRIEKAQYSRAHDSDGSATLSARSQELSEIVARIENSDFRDNSLSEFVLGAYVNTPGNLDDNTSGCARYAMFVEGLKVDDQRYDVEKPLTSRYEDPNLLKDREKILTLVLRSVGGAIDNEFDTSNGNEKANIRERYILDTRYPNTVVEIRSAVTSDEGRWVRKNVRVRLIIFDAKKYHEIYQRVEDEKNAKAQVSIAAAEATDAAVARVTLSKIRGELEDDSGTVDLEGPQVAASDKVLESGALGANEEAVLIRRDEQSPATTLIDTEESTIASDTDVADKISAVRVELQQLTAEGEVEAVRTDSADGVEQQPTQGTAQSGQVIKSVVVTKDQHAPVTNPVEVTVAQTKEEPYVAAAKASTPEYQVVQAPAAVVEQSVKVVETAKHGDTKERVIERDTEPFDELVRYMQEMDVLGLNRAQVMSNLLDVVARLPTEVYYRRENGINMTQRGALQLALGKLSGNGKLDKGTFNLYAGKIPKPLFDVMRQRGVFNLQ